MFTNQAMIFPKGMINSQYRFSYSGLGGCNEVRNTREEGGGNRRTFKHI